MAQSQRVVIVTGAAHGIGLACARRFAEDGAAVVVADRDVDAGKSAAADIEANGGRAIFVHVNIGERLDAKNLMAATLEAFGRVDVLINNAAVDIVKDFLELEESDWDQVMKVNLKGPFLLSQAVAGQMKAQIEEEDLSLEAHPNYVIINISSVDALITQPDRVPFSVSKGALNQLTKVLSLSLAQYGVRVNAIGPGNIMTETSQLTDSDRRKKVASVTPLGRVGSAEEIAGIAAFLASDAAGYMTGQCIYADGGRLVQDYSRIKASL